MGKDTKIEWTDSTLNLWWGCTKVRNNRLCDNCYADRRAKRWGDDVWGDDKPRKAVKNVWKRLTQWQFHAHKNNTRLKIFTMSMGDIFEKPMSLVDRNGDKLPGDTGQLRDRLFDEITRGMYPNLDFQLLTKRPKNIMRMIPQSWHNHWPDNVWIGTSAGDMPNVVRNLDALSKVPARIKFLSAEPLMQDLKLDRYLDSLSWVIVGGESGHGARPMHPRGFRIFTNSAPTKAYPSFLSNGVHGGQCTP